MGGGGASKLREQRLLVKGALYNLEIRKLILEAVQNVLRGRLSCVLTIAGPDNEIWMRKLRSNRGFIASPLDIESGAEAARRRALIQHADEVETLVIVQGVVSKAHRFGIDAKSGIFHFGENNL